MSVIADERIDFHQLSKPANLKNSAVLRMLEEEENRKRNGHPITGSFHDVNKIKHHIKWPPENVNNNGKKNLSWIPSRLSGAKQVVWPPPPETEDFAVVEESPVYSQGGAQFHNQQSSPVQQQRSNQSVSPNFGQPQQQKQQQQQSPLSPQPFSGSQPGNRWGPVPLPVTAQSQSQYQAQPTQAYRPPIQEPPPSTITLRNIAPISQAPAPVFTSQPATASLNGGLNMRGDQKWPPASVKQQFEVENDQRKQIAKGPAFRPRKVKKDYSNFFAQHALNSTYPGYRAPPGTQHYAEEQSGITNF